MKTVSVGGAIVKERPIIMSGESVREIIAGRKTQTRRVIQPQPRYSEEWGSWMWSKGAGWGGSWMNSVREEVTNLTTGKVTVSDRTIPIEEWLTTHSKRPYSVGDRLWVKEAWNVRGLAWGKPAKFTKGMDSSWFYYKATDKGEWKDYWGEWRSPMFMPRWAARLTLEISEIRVQRVQEISNEDAEAEGCQQETRQCRNGNGEPLESYVVKPWEVFAERWNALNTKRGFPWSENPWVWAITFRRVAQ